MSTSAWQEPLHTSLTDHGHAHRLLDYGAWVDPDHMIYDPEVLTVLSQGDIVCSVKPHRNLMTLKELCCFAIMNSSMNGLQNHCLDNCVKSLYKAFL